MPRLLDDLHFIQSAMEMLHEALNQNNIKLANACIQAIQNYLNGQRHPLTYFSMSILYDGSVN